MPNIHPSFIRYYASRMMDKHNKKRIESIFKDIRQFHASHDEVINLKYLLDDIMGNLQRLDWETFVHNEQVQPLHIIATNVRNLSSIILSRDRGHFYDFQSLLQCMRASMLVPGLTGPMMALNPFHLTPYSYTKTSIHVDPAFTPLCDAFLTEPMPYRSAMIDGATHIIMLRTRPDPCPTLGHKPGIFETIVGKKFFHSYQEQAAVDWLLTQSLDCIYAEDGKLSSITITT